MELGLNLVIYPSSLVNASRVMKLGQSLQEGIDFVETQLVGIQPGDLPDRESVAPQVDIVRVRGSARTGTLGRILKVALWQPRVYLRYRTARLSFVAAQNVWILPLCWQLCRKTGALLAYNPHELETETTSMRGLKRWAARRIESRYIPRAAVVSTVSASIADWYESRYGLGRPVVVGNVPISADGRSELRADLGLDDDAVLYVHTGHLVERRNIPTILRAFEAQPACHVVFFGDGPLREDVERSASEFPNIHRLDPVAPNLVVANVRAADVALCLTEPAGLSNQRACPNKLMEGLAANTPVLCSDLIEARRVLGDLASEWILADPEADLQDALLRIDRRAVQAFRAQWKGVPSWADQVGPLVEAYRAAIGVTAGRHG